MKKPKEINQLGKAYNNGTIKNGFKIINVMDYEDLYILRQAMIKWRDRGDDMANILDLFKNKSGNSRLLVSGMKATRFQYLYVRSDILLISRWSVDCSIPI